MVEENIGLLEEREGENKYYLLASHLKILGLEIDLLLTDKDGNLSIVELKRGRSSREAIAQLFDYATLLSQVSLDDLERKRKISEVFKKVQNDHPDLYESEADFRMRLKDCLKNGRFTLLLVSYQIDDRTKEVMSYLRNTYGIKIGAVEFKYFEDDKNEFFAADFIGMEEIKAIQKREPNPTQRKYLDILSELLEDFGKRNPGVTRAKSVSGNYLQIPSGYSSIHFEWWIHRDWVEVGLHFESPDRGKNVKLLHYFERQKKKLEEKIGYPLYFIEKWGKCARLCKT